MHRPPQGAPQPGGGGGPGAPYYCAPPQNPSAAFPYHYPPNARYYWSPLTAAPVPQPGVPQLVPSPQNPTPYLQNPPGYRPQAVNTHGSGHSAQELLGRVEAALAKAHQDLLAAGESVSAWKVSQSALMALQVDSWAALGFQFQDIPYLRRLVATEGKVNAFIHCYVGVRRITSVYDLDISICKNEGIEQFANLGLGPLLCHPLVVHYFSVPPDTTKVPRILTEDIISCLSSYMDKSKKMIMPEEFLDFLVEKHAVETKEKLGVRIQSLGMHISCIREAKKAEHMALDNSLKELKHALDNKTRTERRQPTQPPNMALEKQVLDGRFGFISKRIKSFSSECEVFEGKHIKFDTSDDDDSGSDSKTFHQNTSKANNGIPQRVSSCPYPSTTEERERLGLKSEPAERIPKSRQTKNKNLSGRKRKFKEQNKSGNSLSLGHEEDQVVHTDDIEKEKDHEIALSSNMMEKFITIWKEACREHSVGEVLDMMLNFYNSTVKIKKKTRKIFSSYPGVGLLNIAVASIKCGMLDSIYEIFQDIEQHGFNDSKPASTETIEIELPVKENENLLNKACTDKLECRVTVEDVIQKVSNYFQLYLPKPRADHPLGNKLVILRTFHDCELWLGREFSVDVFGSLGYGHFFDFLEQNFELIPTEVRTNLIGGSYSSRLEVTVDQLQVLLSQAQENLTGSGDLTQRYVSKLLVKQFPTICLNFIGDEAEYNFRDLIRRQKESGTSNYVFYSTTLLGKFFIEKSKKCVASCSSEALGMTNEVDREVGSLGPVSGKDAIECLCKAPMLSDVRAWSHWDLVFAPTLGPMLAWLPNQIHNVKLSFIATTDGRIVRIDNSATAEDFLEASIRGLPFHAALKLLSLLALYGGTNNIPLALLKCYAQRAIDVIVKNSMDREDRTNEFLHGSSLRTQVVPDNNVNANTFSTDIWGTEGTALNKGIDVAAKFILNCLEHLPSEFHVFAAEIFMSGLRSSTKDAPFVMLHQCKQSDQRIMLHDIGLSLGIVEWIEDYRLFNSATAIVQEPSRQVFSVFPAFKMDLRGGSEELSCSSCKIVTSRNSEISNSGLQSGTFDESQNSSIASECSDERCDESCGLVNSEDRMIKNANLIVESIRLDEFGLDPNFKYTESDLLKKQHARLGRALHCLSQELYSQDSHLLLELVQNADDNTYPETVEPTLVFILQPTGMIVLNNERGFSAENIRALCDIGNSTKKGSGAGYIGHKGIGFKSVFRVTDAPEIHSNGFHVKFDISEGQIGFVLPTVISPCNVSLFEAQISSEVDRTDASCWNTCIVLPFRSELKEKPGMSSIMSLFSDLHPSLLLFLHRLQCIKFRNTLNDSLIVMRKETLGDGIVKVSFGTEKMNWLVVRRKLQASVIRPDVQKTEIAVAFTLQESDSGEYKPYLSQQPVFAFLPLRTYGLRFILQGDFVLPSSREEVDGDSAWNQWLLSEFPDLFVSAKRDFAALPWFKNCPGKAVTAFMSFVPLAGEVHGFFSYLPHMIVSKLRTSNCLLLEGHEIGWVPPCRVLRGWDKQAQALLSDKLLQRHLGLGYLNRDIRLSDSLAKALGIRDYGPKILTEIMSSICRDGDAVQQLGLEWLSNWLINLSSAMSRVSSGYLTQDGGLESDVISTLKSVPFIPLSNGSYGSIAEGPIWFCDSFNIGFEGRHDPKDFPSLYAKLRTVTPMLISAASSSTYDMEEPRVENLLRILHKIGVKQLSAHEVIKRHILPALSDTKFVNKDKNLMVEYLSYVMLHFQHACSSCQIERMGIITELRNKSIILTNHGYKSPIEEPVHFSREFGNPVDKNKLINPADSKWNEVDDIYLKHYSTQSVSSRLLKWREFFQELGVTDFVQVIHAEKSVEDFLNVVHRSVPCHIETSATGLLVSDWESPELIHLLSALSSGKQREKCTYLLEVLDQMWDECYGSDVRKYVTVESIEGRHPLQSSFLKCLHDFRWIASSADEELHYPKDLFYDCEAVRSLLGSFAPYAMPQVNSKKFLNDIGFKTQVTFDDALATIQSCGTLQGPVSVSILQMSNFYSFIWEQTAALKNNMDEFKSHPFIFVPSSYSSRCTDTVSGMFLSSNQVYWHDPTGCLDQVKEAAVLSASAGSTAVLVSNTLANVYPTLHDFFVNDCSVQETPPFTSYVQILLQLSSVTLPSQTAHLVFQVFLKWADDLKAGRVQTEEIVILRENLRKLENTVLPTLLDKWVSLHPTFGLICWSDNEELRNEFKHSNNVDFIQFGELSSEDKEMLSGRVSTLLQKIGVPALSEVVSREAIFYGTEDCRGKTYLVNWVLPYAQRYLFKLHPDKYPTLKKSVVEKLALLQITVVDKLFYRHTIRVRGCGGTSRKRFECSCLLQDNILYVTRTSDSHSIFLELSRVFFDGSAELHFANFLHMVATMADSGSTEEQIEFFIVNSQQVPKLPIEEMVWSLSLQGVNTSQTACPVLMNTGQSILSHTRKPGIIPNWPPTDWKTAPGFSRACHFGTVPVPASYGSLTIESSKPPEGVILPEYISCSVDVSGDWIMEDNSTTVVDSILDDLVSPKVHSHSVGLSGPINGQGESSLEKVGTGDSVSPLRQSVKSDDLRPYAERGTFGFQALNDDRSRKTGILGEALAYKYFSEKYSTISVKWVNEESETGLPYDLVIGDEEGSREFVEVKATRSATKDWFPITTREWQFAAEKGEFYSIAHIVLVGPKNVKITVFKNPLRLCQQNLLHLAVLMPRR